jgi:gliding motility-associated-like protein
MEKMNSIFKSSIMQRLIWILLIQIFLFIPAKKTFGQCPLVPSACTGTPVSGSANITIPAGTTYYVPAGQTLSGNVTFASGTSVLCIEGTFTGDISGNPPAGATINVYGTVNSPNAWSFSGGGMTINIFTGASFTISSWSTSGGTYTVNNCGTITTTGNIGSTGGTIVFNNYGSIVVGGVINSSNTGFTFNNKPGSSLTVNGPGNGIGFSAGTFVNDGNICVKNTAGFSGGSLTNNKCIQTTGFGISGSNAFYNNYIVVVTGDYNNSGTNTTNNGIVTVYGDFSNTGTFVLGPGSQLTSRNWTNSGTIVGPNSGCGSFIATGVTGNSGTISATNSSRVDIKDTGNPPPTGSPAANIDNNSGNVNSATFTGTCTPVNLAPCTGVCAPVCTLAVSVTKNDASCNGGNNGSATANPSNGTNPYTYSWTTVPVQTTQVATGLTAGTYTVTLTDYNGCDTTATVTIGQPSALSRSVSKTDVSCNNGSNGSITVTPSGGTNPYTYSWTTVPPQTGSIATGLIAGTYTVTITDNNGCTITASRTINQPSALTNSTTQVNVACSGGNNGSATSTPSGGTSPYTYNWSGGGTTPSITGLSAGNYTVTVTDLNGCQTSSVVTISQAGSLIATNSKSDVLCNSGNTGSIDVTVTGGTAPYTYFWSPGGQTSQDLSNITAGTYSVTVTDNNGCSTVLNVTVAEPAVLDVTTTSTDVSCYAGSDGSINTNTTGGTQPYTYQWSNGSTTQNVSGLTAGNYTVTVTDNNGCTDIASVVITEPVEPLQLNTFKVDVTCTGANDGSATVNPIGGTSPYTYSWSTVPFQSTPVATGLSGGIYTVSVTDIKGCTKTASVTILESPVPLTGSITNAVPVSCTGSSDGSATVTPSGGTSPYTFTWSTVPPQNGPSATGLSGGSYTVTVTDIFGCSVTDNIIINESPVLFNITIGGTIPVTCTGSNDGSATVVPNGGTSPYTYSWSTVPPQATPTATGLSGGTYTVTATDLYGCSRTATATVNESPVILAVVIANSTPVSCNGSGDGTSTATPSGGTSPYTYSWSTVPSQTTPSATGLSGGVYTITVTDAYGCSRTATTQILESPQALNAPISGSSPVTCTGSNDGTATVTPSGGTTPYTYSWSIVPAQTNAIATGLSGGTYTVTVTDNFGCSATSTVMINESPVLLSVNINNSTPVSCTGSGDGTATSSPSGGTAPYTYSWSTVPPQATPDATGLSGGIYTVTVTDSYGCTKTASVTINESPVILGITISNQTPVTCTGDANGSASVAVTGGTSPYTYSWSTVPPQTSDIAIGLSGGTYTVTVTDSYGCSRTVTARIDESNQMLSLSISNVVPVTCTGSGDGSATVSPTGGTQPYTYSWNTVPAQTTPNANGLSGGVYTVTVTDVYGCSKTVSVTINESPSLLTVNLTTTDVTCNGMNDGTATVTHTGGTGPYTYTWSPSGPNSTSRNGLAPGVYTITVTDAYGCSKTATSVIAEPPAVVAGFTADPVTGNMPLPVTFTNTSSGATGYTWSFGDGTGDTAANSIHVYDAQGDYTVMLIAFNASGCPDTAYIKIKVTEKSRLVIPNIFTPNRDGNNDIFPLIEDGIVEVKGIIYNRWGEMINKFNTVNGGWDGRTASGLEASDGVYYYVIEALGSDGVTYKSHGFVTLVR